MSIENDVDLIEQHAERIAVALERIADVLESNRQDRLIEEGRFTG